MAPNAIMKNFSREAVYVRPNGPLTGSLVLVWNALIRARLLRVPGQMAKEGQTRNRRVSPAVRSVCRCRLTGHAVTNETGTKRIEQLVAVVPGKRLIKECVQSLYGNDVRRVGR